MLVAFEEDGEVCTIPYSKILKDQVLLDWFCTRPLSFPVLRIWRMYNATAAFYKRTASVLHACTVYSYYTHGTHVYSILHAWYTRVQHTTCVYTHGVMPRVLLCKLCACVTRVFCMCHACLLRVARVSSACGTRVTRVDCLSCG